MRPRTDRQTDTPQTRVTTIHFASSTTHAKCNEFYCATYAMSQNGSSWLSNGDQKGNAETVGLDITGLDIDRRIRTGGY